jgi:hypothetical protein
MSVIQETASGLQKTAADLLGIWGAYERAKVDIRFLELQNQNKALEVASVSQNAQAAATVRPAQSVSDWVSANPMLAAGAGLGVAALIWLAVR